MPDSESDPSPLDRAIEEYGREELEILCDLLSELALEDRGGIAEYSTDDLVKLITALSHYLQGRQNLYHHLQAINETPIEEENPELVRTSAKITRWRNERLKEEIQELKSRNEDLGRRAMAEQALRVIFEQQAVRLESQLEEERAKIASQRTRSEDDRDLTPEDLARAVVQGKAEEYKLTPKWKSGDQLLNCLQMWAENHFGESVPTSKSTIRRRMMDGDLLVSRNGTIDLQSTRDRCWELVTS